MIHKRKKFSRFRASRTHGCGQINRRGKGHKGGTGNAGSGKRADCKKPSYWKLPEGKIGFKPKGPKLFINPINISQVEELILKGQLKEEDGSYDLGKLGYNKLLGKGCATKKIKIKVLKASKNASEEIKNIGGEIILG